MDLTTVFSEALSASRSLIRLTQQKIDSVLVALSRSIIENKESILRANSLDLAAYDRENPLYDRLLLTSERLDSIAQDMIHVSTLSSPVGEVIDSWQRDNGMVISKRRVPFGVVGVIYESRPNVSFDVFALCFKSSNGCILKGGSDARHSNHAIVSLITQVLREQEIDPRVVTLLPADREATAALLSAVGYVDLIIPRGGSSLINYVRENSRVPVIETGAGVCHTYIDQFADVDRARAIVENAKTRRVSVCNALDCLVVDRSQLSNLASICAPLSAKGVTIYADCESFAVLRDCYPTELLLPSEQGHYGQEFLDYKLSVKTTSSLEEAVEHISEYSSGHSEAIVSEDCSHQDYFCSMVDAACVYVNVSTAFTDGAQFGFGAEIGISTQKLHARGPMALAELTTYKYIIVGNGQVRS
ncbi:MAG: glutamate-5-semialdehyde dehydrogenase [Rikenellaceae bacterium]